MKKLSNLLLFFLCLYVCPAIAGINEDLSNYFNELGFSSNITSAQAYHGQEAGFYTGGSIFARTPVKNVQLLEVDLPSYRSGCSGIDLYTGGFSFINSDQMIPLMRNIMNNAGSYAFTLALETASPSLANVMKYWNDYASRVNQANINSCEMAESLVGGMWPKVRSAQQRVCQDVGSSKGLFSDWAQAKQRCSTGNEFSSTMNKAKNDPYYKNFAFDSGNITWKVIKQNHLFGDDHELSQFLMSLSGTVILHKTGSNDDAPVKYILLPSLMDKDKNNLVKTLLDGGEVTIYHCDTSDENGCLHPSSNGKAIIAKEKAFGNRVRHILDNMVNKIIEDKPLSPEEIGLLESTSLPIYKILNVQTAFSKDKNTIDIAGYSDAIASDILFEYLQSILRKIRNNIMTAQFAEEITAELKPAIDKEIDQLHELQTNAYSRLAISNQLIQKTQLLEKSLAGELAGKMSDSIPPAGGLK